MTTTTFECRWHTGILLSSATSAEGRQQPPKGRGRGEQPEGLADELFKY